jgi:hypothetical protein
MEQQLREAFEKKIRNSKSSTESFSMCMCDLELCSDHQRALLAAILLRDHRSPVHWLDYIECVRETLPLRRYSMNKLLQKAFDVIGDEPRDSKHIVSLHLVAADLCKGPSEAIKYMESAFHRGIGRRSALFFLKWAEFAVTNASPTIEVRAIINKVSGQQ